MSRQGHVVTWASAVCSVVAGLRRARAGHWSSWRRSPVLPVGIWMLGMLPLQFTSLLPVTVAVYAATVATAVALLAEPGSRQP